MIWLLLIIIAVLIIGQLLGKGEESLGCVAATVMYVIGIMIAMIPLIIAFWLLVALFG